MDPKKLRSVFTEARMKEEEYEAFEQIKDSCLLGKITADKYKLKVGDRITLPSTVYPCTLDFKIVGIYAGTPDDRNMLFRQDYLDEGSGVTGMVGMWWLKVKSAEDMPKVIAAINKAFENTSAEVRAETERAFQLGFISMWGNIKLLVSLVSSAVVFTLLLVTASTMSMAIRERFRELAILKAIGYRRRELFAFILAESFTLALAGAVIGVGGAYALFTYGDVAKMTNGGGDPKDHWHRCVGGGVARDCGQHHAQYCGGQDECRGRAEIFGLKPSLWPCRLPTIFATCWSAGARRQPPFSASRSL
jgi:putative ABC transport system permease protein